MLRRCAERGFAETAEIGEQVAQLRRKFFYVDGYGELMEDWLQNRIRQFNEDFLQRAAAGMGLNLSAVSGRLRRTFRPGRWLSLTEQSVEDDLFALFLDESFPRHVLTTETIGKVLLKVSTFGGLDFHVYGNIARLAAPPGSSPPSHGSGPPPPAGTVEAAVQATLQRLPPFAALRRLRPGVYLFGRVEVEFRLHGNELAAAFVRPGAAPPRLEELPAVRFFEEVGLLEFPLAARLAVQASEHEQYPAGPPSTTIEVHPASIAAAAHGLPPSVAAAAASVVAAGGLRPPDPFSRVGGCAPRSAAAPTPTTPGVAPLTVGAPRFDTGACGGPSVDPGIRSVMPAPMRPSMSQTQNMEVTNLGLSNLPHGPPRIPQSAQYGAAPHLPAAAPRYEPYSTRPPLPHTVPGAGMALVPPTPLPPQPQPQQPAPSAPPNFDMSRSAGPRHLAPPTPAPSAPPGFDISTL
eukprot:NODE_6768_length_1640_cov_8.166557.p1 GENE.NODE_6768_length_1640_cov_8.166557~~NODE_6768_length_1640_cov_8.166557.p1  ORF type:complete len:494 (+),score=104.55 NODE_6768_length_1640_cov_8.166557:96-1484(+)